MITRLDWEQKKIESADFQESELGNLTQERLKQLRKEGRISFSQPPFQLDLVT